MIDLKKEMKEVVLDQNDLATSLKHHLENEMQEMRLEINKIHRQEHPKTSPEAEVSRVFCAL